jgi:hypothetical protein
MVPVGPRSTSGIKYRRGSTATTLTPFPLLSTFNPTRVTSDPRTMMLGRRLFLRRPLSLASYIVPGSRNAVDRDGGQRRSAANGSTRLPNNLVQGLCDQVYTHAYLRFSVITNRCREDSSIPRYLPLAVFLAPSPAVSSPEHYLQAYHEAPTSARYALLTLL